MILGHGRVPVPRAGRHRRRGRPQRRLRGRRAALRAAHRRAAVHRRHRDLGGLPARELTTCRRRRPIAGDVPPELDELVVRATRRDPAGAPGRRRARCSRELRRVAERLGGAAGAAAGAACAPVDEPDGAARRHRTGAAGSRASAVSAGIRLPGRAAPARCRRPDAGDRPPHRGRTCSARRRSRRVFGGGDRGRGVLGAARRRVAAWWLGSGRWTAMPTRRRAGAGQRASGCSATPTCVATHHRRARRRGAPRARSTATDPAAAGPAAARQHGAAHGLDRPAQRCRRSPPGTPVAAAEQAIRDAGLTPVRTAPARSTATRDDDSDDRVGAAGTVLRTEPDAGTELPAARR